MKRNDDPRCSNSRRSFLKTAAAGALVAAGPAVGAESDRKTPRRVNGSAQAETLLKRYGGEFGDLGRGGA